MKKKILIVSALIALLAVAVVGGTLAYFTDTKEVTNTFTMGNVKIAVVEKQYADDNSSFEAYEQDKPLLPGVATDKFVSVQNTGSNAAYIRVTYKYLTDSAPVLDLIIPENGSYTIGDAVVGTDGYTRITVTYNERLNAKVNAENPAPVSDRILSTVALDPSFDWVYEDDSVTGYSYHNGEARVTVNNPTLDTTVTVIAEAIQADGFDTATAAWLAFDAQK